MATIDTLPPINVSGTSVILRFEVLDDGNPDGCESWSASIGYKPHSSDTWMWLQNIIGAGEGTFQQNIMGLTPNIQYDVTSKITNSAGTAYGDIETFRIEMQSGILSVATLPASNITQQSVELELLLIDDGDPSIVTQANTRFTYWSIDEQPQTTQWFSTTEGQQSSITIYELNPDTIYWFNAQAKNSEGQVNGNTLSFKTLPDPNSRPIAFDSNEPDTLLVQNFVKALQTDPNNPHENQGIVTYMEKEGNLATLDANDIFYSTRPEISKASKVVSLVPEIKAGGEVSWFYELSKDARPEHIATNDPNNLVLLELSIFGTHYPDANTTSDNSLKFWLPNDTNSVALNNSFSGKPLTLQQISSDPNEANLVYPLWDIRRIIEKNGRQLPLNKLSSQKANTPYAFFELSTTKELLDINEDEIIDLDDYALMLEDFEKTGIFRSDIAGEKGLGLPDGKVDAIDELTFIAEYNKLYPENPISNPYMEYVEDFESGNIQEPFTGSGDACWIIDSDSYTGNYCAKSGNIENNQSSVLEAYIDTTSGKISFYYRISCELGYDYLLFLIDDIETGRWSGRKDWEKVDFQTTPGTHNFKWIYIKDVSTSEGEDAAWIDNIEFPTY